MVALASEDDQITSGNSQWNDVGYIQQSATSKDGDVADEQDLGISTLNKEKNKIIVSEEKAEKAAEIRDEINDKENSDQNKQLFASINEKLQDKSFIEMAVQTSMKKEGEKHTQDYEPDTEYSSDLAKKDYGGRHTDQMGEWEKDYEDNYNQGDHNTKETNEIKNQAKHYIEGSWDKYGPTNVPKHLTTKEFKAADGVKSNAKSGVVLVYLTVDNDEHATRFVKALFNKDLIAAANQFEANFERTYLKLGRMSTEKGRDKLELTTTVDKVADLIDYINQNPPTLYDYPVPDTIAIPVETGNPKWLSWVQKTISSNTAGLKEIPGDKDTTEE